MDKIICLGKNYLDHALEMQDRVPEKPVIFIKPESVLRTAAQQEELLLAFPEVDAGSLHHEIEIVLRIGKGGYKIDRHAAQSAIDAVTIGLDMTLRDRQAAQKKQGDPWTTSKVFRDSAVIGPWIELSHFPHYLDEQFSLTLNNDLKQQSFGRNMLLKPIESISYISHFFPLMPGDLIFTGTPAGVGPVKAGQKGVLRYGPITYSVIWQAS